MAYSYPKLEAINGRGFNHLVYLAGTIPRDLVASVEGSRENWPLAQLFAASLTIVGQLGGGLGTAATHTLSPEHATQGATWPAAFRRTPTRANIWATS